jgi:radical SAM superfamily enzyme YgiQ (UPF0313 family)
MKKKIYIIQPTYRLMDGKLIKEFPLFNYSYNLPILSATIPDDWERETCLEYTEEVNFSSDASIVIITSPGYDVAHAVEIIEIFKKQGKIVIFGAHLDGFTDSLLKQTCDAVFYGYPDPSQMEILLNEAETNNLKAEYSFGKGLNFPFDYSVLKNTKMAFVPLIASMGCKHKCTYCCYPPFYNGHYYLRRLEYVISDFKQAVEFKKPIAFLDANIYNNRKYLISLCTAIIENKISVLWGGQCTVNIGNDKEVLNLLYKAGCRMLFLGLESLDNDNLRLLNKPMNADLYSEQIANIHNAGIVVGAFFLLGLDGDDSTTFEKVYTFFQKNKVEVPYAHIYFPIPGTSLAEDLKSQERILGNYFEKYLEKKVEFSAPCSVAYFSPLKLSKQELESGFVELFRKITSLKSIFRRAINKDFRLAIIILQMNLEARRKYKSMRRNAKKSKRLERIELTKEVKKEMEYVTEQI